MLFHCLASLLQVSHDFAINFDPENPECEGKLGKLHQPVPLQMLVTSSEPQTLLLHTQLPDPALRPIQSLSSFGKSAMTQHHAHLPLRAPRTIRIPLSLSLLSEELGATLLCLEPLLTLPASPLFFAHRDLRGYSLLPPLLASDPALRSYQRGPHHQPRG